MPSTENLTVTIRFDDTQLAAILDEFGNDYDEENNPHLEYAHNELDKAKARIAELESSLSESRRYRNAIQTGYDNASREVAERDQLVSELRAELAETARSFESMREDRNHYRNQLNETSRELTMSQGDTRRLRADRDALRAGNRELRDERDTYRTAYEECKAERDTATASRDNLRESLDMLEASLQGARNALTERTYERDRTAGELDRLRQALGISRETERMITSEPDNWQLVLRVPADPWEGEDSGYADALRRQDEDDRRNGIDPPHAL